MGQGRQLTNFRALLKAIQGIPYMPLSVSVWGSDWVGLCWPQLDECAVQGSRSGLWFQDRWRLGCVEPKNEPSGQEGDRETWHSKCKPGMCPGPVPLGRHRALGLAEPGLTPGARKSEQEVPE